VPVCFTEVSSVAWRLGLPAKDFPNRLIEPDAVARYTETDACGGSLGRFCGVKLMQLMFHYAQRRSMITHPKMLLYVTVNRQIEQVWHA
jgi:hypothetical protein